MPLLFFLAACGALVLAEWSKLINFTMAGMMLSGVIVGSMVSLLYYVHTFGQLDPVLGFYPFLAVWSHDAVSFVVGRIWGKVKISPDLEGKTTVLGFLAGVLTLLAVNAYVLNNHDPLSMMNFPITYLGLLGFSVLSSLLILVGRVLVHGTTFWAGQGVEARQEVCPSGFGFLEPYSSFVLFAYLVAIISFGRDMAPKILTFF